MSEQVSGDASPSSIVVGERRTRSPRPARQWAGPFWPQLSSPRRRFGVGAPALRRGGGKAPLPRSERGSEIAATTTLSPSLSLSLSRGVSRVRLLDIRCRISAVSVGQRQRKKAREGWSRWTWRSDTSLFAISNRRVSWLAFSFWRESW